MLTRLSTPIHKYGYVRGKGFLCQTRRERRAYPSAVCKERATTSGAKGPAARRVAPHLALGVVAPRSQTASGYAPSSRLAQSQMRRNERNRIYELEYLGLCEKQVICGKRILNKNYPHPDPLPSDGRGNSQTRRSQLLKRLDTPTDGGRFSLSHRMGEGRGEGECALKSEVVFTRALRTPIRSRPVRSTKR